MHFGGKAAGQRSVFARDGVGQWREPRVIGVAEGFGRRGRWCGDGAGFVMYLVGP